MRQESRRTLDRHLFFVKGGRSGEGADFPPPVPKKHEMPLRRRTSRSPCGSFKEPSCCSHSLRSWLMISMLPWTYGPMVDSEQLEHGNRMICAGFASFFGREWSTVMFQLSGVYSCPKSLVYVKGMAPEAPVIVACRNAAARENAVQNVCKTQIGPINI